MYVGDYISKEIGKCRLKSNLFGGITQLVIHGKRIEETVWNETELYREHKVVLKDTIIKAIPYAYWNNRGIGEMAVWIKGLI